MMKVTCDTEQEYFLQQTVYQKLEGCNMPDPKCKGSLLVDFAAELQQIRDSLSFAAGQQHFLHYSLFIFRFYFFKVLSFEGS